MIESLPRREREVFETLCRLQAGTTSAVRIGFAGNQSLGLEARQQRPHRRVAQRAAHCGPDGVLYRPAPRPETIAASALRRTVDTFFAGSAASAATALLGLTQRLKPEELEALERAIDQARERIS